MYWCEERPPPLVALQVRVTTPSPLTNGTRVVIRFKLATMNFFLLRLGQTHHCLAHTGERRGVVRMLRSIGVRRVCFESLTVCTPHLMRALCLPRLPVSALTSFPDELKSFLKRPTPWDFDSAALPWQQQFREFITPFKVHTRV